MPARYLTVADTAVHYLYTGRTSLPGVPPPLERGTLFLLVPAAGDSAGTWQPQLDGLGAAHSALALDLPGHGRSTGLDGLATIEAYADFVAAFAAALALRRFVLVGRSMGGAIGLVFAVRHPQRLAGLVLACTAARFAIAPETLATLRDVVRGRLPQQFTSESFSPSTPMDIRREAWREQAGTDPRVRLTDLCACQGFDGRALLPRIGVPTLVVAGADDQVTPVGAAEEMAREIPAARLAVVAQAGHQAPLEQAEAFNRLVVEFAEGLA